MQVSLSGEASAGAGDAFGWYIGEGATTVAEGFVNELEHALGLLRLFPIMGRAGAREIRVLPFPTYAYYLVY